MRIALVGSTAQEACLERFYESALRRLGHQTSLTWFWPVPMGNPIITLVLRSPFRTALVRGRARTLAHWFQDERVELVIVFKLPELDREAIEAWKADGRTIINVYPDSPLAHPGADGASLLEGAPAYDAQVTFARSLVPVWYQLGARRVLRIPFAHAPEVHFPEAPRPGDESLGNGVVYLGHAGRLQRWWLAQLQEFSPRIYGLGWEPATLAGRLRRLVRHRPPSAVGYGTGMRLACSAARIVFNMVRAEHGCAHSMKTFEIPACGGFQITNRTDEQLEFFREDREAVYYSTPAELQDKIRFYLRHESERSTIAQAGRAVALTHPYDSRARELVAAARELRRAP
ncbi:MAG: glycosyltransferase [Planctomycetales bacterium]|nr:glycosyltransferase [Planctomycetales bacterium]